MSARTKPPFRADHVGSLLRPQELLAARDDHAAGRIDDDQLRAIENDAIRDVVAMQKDVGLQSATDGEFRRTSWHMDFIYQLNGVKQVDGDKIHVQFRNEEGEYDYAPPAHARVRARRARRRRSSAMPSRSCATRCDGATAEAHDPLAEHGPLPRRRLLDRPLGVPGHGGLLGRSHGAYREQIAAPRRPRLPLPPARRHEPRLHQRPGAARAHRRRSAATPTTCTSSTSRTSTRAG